MINVHEDAFAWDESEKGQFSSEYFDDVVIPTIEHIPWALRNIPIPPGIYDRVIEIIKAKIESGIYQESSSSYRLALVLRSQEGRKIASYCPRSPAAQRRHYSRMLGYRRRSRSMLSHLGGRGCYGMFDLFVGFDPA